MFERYLTTPERQRDFAYFSKSYSRPIITRLEVEHFASSRNLDPLLAAAIGPQRAAKSKSHTQKNLLPSVA